MTNAVSFYSQANTLRDHHNPIAPVLVRDGGRTYTKTSRTDAVVYAATVPHLPKTVIAKNLGVCTDTLRRWTREIYQQNPTTPTSSSSPTTSDSRSIILLDFHGSPKRRMERAEDEMLGFFATDCDLLQSTRPNKRLKIADGNSPGFFKRVSVDAQQVVARFLTIEERSMLLTVCKQFAEPVRMSFADVECIDTLTETRHAHNATYVVACLAKQVRPKLVFLAAELSGLWSLAHIQKALPRLVGLQEMRVHFTTDDEETLMHYHKIPGGPFQTGNMLRGLGWRYVKGNLQVSKSCVPPERMSFPRKLRVLKLWGTPKPYLLNMSLLETLWCSAADDCRYLQQLRISFSLKPVVMKDSSLRYVLEHCRHLTVLELTNVKLDDAALFGNEMKERSYPRMKALHLGIPPYFMNLDKDRCTHLVSLFPNMEVFSIQGHTITTVALEYLNLSPWISSIRALFLNVALDINVLTRKENRVRFPHLKYLSLPIGAFSQKENVGLWSTANEVFDNYGCFLECWDPNVSEMQHHIFSRLVEEHIRLPPVWKNF